MKLTAEDLEQGAILLVDKPLGWTSFDVVNKLRLTLKYAIGKKRVKVGHAGTLDPLATGLLIIAFGKKTKELTDLMGQDKTYSATLRLGQQTDSYDAETPVNIELPWEHVEAQTVRTVLAGMVGEIQQRPPVFSAKRIGGQRAYKLARKGQRPEMPKAPVTVYRLELRSFTPPDVEIEVQCSKGTYIRSLAHDIGQELGCGAHLVQLRRLRIGDLDIQDAHGPVEIAEAMQEAGSEFRAATSGPD